MRDVKRVTVVPAVVLFVVASHVMRADEFDRVMAITFSGPVDVPHVVLAAGTYEFKLADSAGDRNVVEVRSDDGSTVYATLLTVPDDRPTPTDDPVVTFDERAAGLVTRSEPSSIRARPRAWRSWADPVASDLAVQGTCEASARRTRSHT
jgi:hypothetical protein